MNIHDPNEGKVLYFPTIEFQSDAWLKSALCVWETIYRIVPPSYAPKDSDEVKQAIDAGLIESIRLSPEDLADTATKFTKFMNEAAEFPSSLSGYDNIRLHKDKVDARILPILQSLSEKINPNGWLSLSEPVANAYMLFLSKTVAQRRGVSDVTDNEDIFTVFSFFGYEGNFDSWGCNPDASEVAALLVLPNLLPTGIEADSMTRVLQFRSQHSEARSAYRASVTAFAKQLVKIEDRQHALHLVNEFEDDLKSGKATGGAKFFAKLDELMHSALVVGIPVALGALIGNRDDFDWRVAGKACGLGAIATMADANKSARSKWKSSDAFYHLQLHRSFSVFEKPRSGMPRYQRVFHEFMDD